METIAGTAGNSGITQIGVLQENDQGSAGSAASCLRKESLKCVARVTAHSDLWADKVEACIIADTVVKRGTTS